MRARRLLAMLAGALAPIAACSSGTSGDGSPVTEAEAGTTREGGLVTADAAPACDPDASLFGAVTDASIADGASTTGICLGCAAARCATEIAQCTVDCPCQSIVGDAVGCYVTTQQLGCAGALTSYLVTQRTRELALQLLGCVRQECPAECGIDGGTDAGDDAD